MTEDENAHESSDEPARDPVADQVPPHSAVAEPADLSELAADGPRPTAPFFDNRPAVLKNPAVIPEPGEHTDLAEAVFAQVTDNLEWVDKPVPSAEETDARRERREARKKQVRRQRTRKRVLLAVAGVLVLLLGLGFAWFQYVFGGLHRMPDVVATGGVVSPGQNFLLVGANPNETSPGRVVAGGWQGDFANSDMVMVIHLDQDKRSMFVISIPRDSAVRIPGHGIGKLADAYATGGANLYVSTIEQLTGLKLDRVMTLDMQGLASMVDVLGGVEVTVPSLICDEPAGPQRLDGQGALEYIALRPCMPDQDLDRVARQQSLLKALMRATVDGGTITHPFRINKLLRAGVSSTTVEDSYSTWNLIGTIWSLRHLRASTTTFLTVPVADQPLSTVNGSVYVRLDQTKDADLWRAVRSDTVAEYLQLNGVATF